MLLRRSRLAESSFSGYGSIAIVAVFEVAPPMVRITLMAGPPAVVAGISAFT